MSYPWYYPWVGIVFIFASITLIYWLTHLIRWVIKTLRGRDRRSMDIVNWLMHRNMKKHATDMVMWATGSYKSVRTAESAISDRDAFRKMLDGRIKFPGGDAARELILDRYGSSINGLCYYLGLNSQFMKGTMVSRCTQYIDYIDAELKKLGFDTPSDAVKSGYFKTLGL